MTRDCLGPWRSSRGNSNPTTPKKNITMKLATSWWSAQKPVMNHPSTCSSVVVGQIIIHTNTGILVAKLPASFSQEQCRKLLDPNLCGPVAFGESREQGCPQTMLCLRAWTLHRMRARAAFLTKPARISMYNREAQSLRSDLASVGVLHPEARAKLQLWHPSACRV